MSDNKPLILCVEDEERWRRRFQQYLKTDYDLAFASTLDEAEQFLATNTPNLALVDISLVPDGPENRDGFVFLDRLLDTSVLGNFPIIVVTAYGTLPEAVTAFTHYRVRHFFSKGSLDPEEFRETVAKHVLRRETGAARALIIEDEPRWQKRLSLLLEKEGCIVDVAATYAEASQKILSKMQSEPYHVVTMDLRLNDETENQDGFELLESLHYFERPLPSIVVSAYGTPEQISRAYRDLDVRDYIFKGSFEPELFRARVREIIDSEFYVIAAIEDGDIQNGLDVDNQYTLTIRTQQSVPLRRPLIGELRALSRARTNSDWEIGVAVSSPSLKMQILPRPQQQLIVHPDFFSETLVYKLTPFQVGRGTIEIEFQRPARYVSNLSFEIVVYDKDQILNRLSV